jgi:LPS export ABC transporter protein LptC
MRNSECTDTSQEQKKTGYSTLSFFCLSLLFAALLAACNAEHDLSKMQPYEGPLMEASDVETLYSDSARVRVRLTAPLEQQMENQDLHFPKGVYLEFFDKEGVKNSTLRGNSGVYVKEKNLYTVTGNVVIIDLQENKTLNTEELNWDPLKQQIFTDKFVTITTQEEILKGEGLDAQQDFSSYQIRKPTGTFSVPQ